MDMDDTADTAVAADTKFTAVAAVTAGSATQLFIVSLLSSGSMLAN